jgi:N6-adenosine-specific RNA methylase IME4
MVIVFQKMIYGDQDQEGKWRWDFQNTLWFENILGRQLEEKERDEDGSGEITKIGWKKTERGGNRLRLGFARWVRVESWERLRLSLMKKEKMVTEVKIRNSNVRLNKFLK